MIVPAARGFTRGDRVRCLRVTPHTPALTEGETYTVERGGEFIIRLEGVESWQYAYLFEPEPRPVNAPVSNAALVRQLEDAHHAVVRSLTTTAAASPKGKALRAKRDDLREQVLARMVER